MRRNDEEIARMRRAGRVVAEMHERIREAIRPGVTTRQLDAIGRDVIERRGARSNFLGYHGFPAVICASPNEVVVHGIPDDRVLVDGDVVSIDCGAIVDGYHGDAAWTHPVGEIASDSAHLLEVGEASLWAGLATVRDGNRLGDVGAAVQAVIDGGGCGLVREYVGHGIGTAMHEEPQVPNYGPAGRGMRLKVGHCLALEPMLTLGRPETRVLADRWTVVTIDGSRAAHFEHTVALTDDGPEVLTVADALVL